MKRLWMSFVSVLLVFSLVLTACGNSNSAENNASESAKDILKTEMEKQADMKSGKISGDFDLKLGEEVITAMMEEAASNPQAMMILNQMLDADVSYRSTFDYEANQMEFILDVALGGSEEGAESTMEFSLPIMMNDEAMWIGVPDIDIIAMFAPQLYGKYIKMSYEELAAMDDAYMYEVSPFELLNENRELQTKAGIDIINAVMGPLDEATFFTQLKADDMELPDGFKADQIVQFSLSDDNLEPFVKAMVQMVPDVLDVYSNPEYESLFGFTEDDLEEMKSQFESEDITEEDIMTALEEMKEAIQIEKFYLTQAFSEDLGQYVSMEADIIAIDNGEQYPFAMNMTSLLSEVNEKVEYEIGIPSEEDSISIMELMGL
ncbi:hypothetical protein [Longirhabdus pacifica]|uniref:hypothetical protein n=1 Tax=Longirhabdus pacifica TaxID=2305227 RepID=UPI0010088676|nr:hypothetical protein [Longirhabdus pacifica]